MRLAVTGASGFVGGALCRAAVAAGHEVLAFGRRARLDSAHVAGADYLSWDITSGPLATPPQVDAVVHCAGSVTDHGRPAELLAANRDGTRAVLAAFGLAARFVHVSTASVYDPLVPTVRARESEADGVRHRDAYGYSKAAAEQVVRALRPDAIILRPHAVYGPGDTTLLPRLLDAVRHGRLIAVGTGRQLLALTAIGNLTAACLLAAGAADEISGTFNVTDATPLTLDDALRSFIDARGLQARPVYLPLRAALPLAAVAEAAARVTGREPRLTRYTVRHLALERTLDISAACDRLGYRPLATSFDGAARW
ncbi:MAG: NAD-dependent epimerase/dehydratase family protein [Catenulispora sp.]|nr:NAD-dependent epimerase/dehydratase family protein [Catenulispora sp.]